MSKKQQERLGQIVADIKTANDTINALFDTADKRTGDMSGVNTQDEINQIKALNKDIEKWEEERKELAEVVGIRDRAAKRHGDFTDPQRHPFQTDPTPGNDGVAIKAFGKTSELVLGDETMKAWLDMNRKSFSTGLNPGQFQSPKVMVDSFLKKSLHSPQEAFQFLKTLITGVSDTSAGAMVFPDFKPIVDQSYQRPLSVKDIITIGQTTSDQVEYVRVGTPTNNAAPVAEATATSGSSGAKPESALPMSRVTESVKTIAHWVPATTRGLADAGQLKTIIDQFLRYGIDEELEDQILTGDGTGENFTGVLNTSNTSSQAFDTNLLTTTRKARTKARVLGRTAPTAWVFHPNDWEDIDLLQDNEARYYFGGPLVMGTPRLWGLPVVESEGMTEGVSVVANWKLAVLWDRMETMISMSNSHADFFVRNLVAVLAEMRAAFGVLRPAAFVETDLTA